MGGMRQLLDLEPNRSKVLAPGHLVVRAILSVLLDVVKRIAPRKLHGIAEARSHRLAPTA